MAGTFNAIDLSQLQPPDVVEVIDYETILAEMIADLQARDPAFTALVESDPAYKILEVAAYRETIIRQRVNDGARAVMLAYATGADLDQIGAGYDVERLLITPGDENTIPPTPPVYESDADFRYRIQLRLEGFTTAGSVGSYIYHALSADGDVGDVAVASPPLVAGQVDVRVLSRSLGAAPAGLLSTVLAALSADEIRPLCDTVVVQSAAIVNYTITASLITFPGVGQAEVLAQAIAAANAYAAAQYKIGRDITRSGVFAALHQPGVQNVVLTAPAADLVVAWNQAAKCTAITVTVGGVGE